LRSNFKSQEKKLDKSKIEVEDKEVRFPFEYQIRTKQDLFKIFVLQNWKSIRRYKRIAPIALILLFVWLITKKIVALIILLPFAILTIIGIIGFWDIWRVRKNWEIGQRPRRAFVKERKLKYGNFGIVLTEEGRNGVSIEKYVWKRYSYIVEWEKYLFLLPAKKKADTFEIREDEIGRENFIEFRDFAKSKLEYRLIESHKELI